MRPFEGIKVLDITEIMAGPMVGAYLGDMGADVIKVERGEGDSIRASKRNTQVYLVYNRSKRGVLIDFKTPKGLEALLRLAAQCDVLIENSRPGVAERRGYGYEQVRERNPEVIYCAISPFGRTGPYANRSAVDWVMQGVSGVMSWTGPEGGEPVRVGPIITDFAAGTMAAMGVLTALYVRERTGKGQRVDVAMLDATFHTFGQRILHHGVYGKPLKPMGTKHPWVAPGQTYQTSDGKLNFNLQDEWRWPMFCEAIGRPDMISDSRFKDNQARYENQDAMNAILEPLFLTKTNREWLELLADGAEQQIGAQNTIEEALADPQVIHNRIIVDMPYPGYPNTKLVDTAVKLSETPGGITRRAPMLGEHTEEVLAEFGFNKAEIDGLQALNE
jgi:CoA:oxalate CoA-transferase